MSLSTLNASQALPIRNTPSSAAIKTHIRKQYIAPTGCNASKFLIKE